MFVLLGTTRGSGRFTATRNSTRRNWRARSLYWSREPDAASGEYEERLTVKVDRAARETDTGVREMRG